MISTQASPARPRELWSSLPADSVTILLLIYAAAMFFSFGTESFQLKIILDAALGVALLAAVYALSRLANFGSTTSGASLPYLPLAIVAAGLLLRIVFGLFVHPTPQSDMASYEMSARELVNTGEYVCRVGSFALRAYRPPGVAFLLATVMRVVGQQPWAALLLNCTLFLITSGALWLALRDSLRPAALLALTLLAFWPSEIMVASLAQSETPTVLASALLIFVAACVRQAWLQVALFGLLTGLSCLVRNSNLVMLGVWLLVVAQLRVRIAQRAALAVLLIACTFAPILPWTLRNDRLLHAPVLIATNGGDNFYSANNPLSGGGWEGTSSTQIHKYLPDEVAMDQAGYRLAKEWIRSHPAAFLRLGVEKIRMLFGSDDWGPYWALARGRNYTGVWYRVALAAAAGWWIILWSLLLIGILNQPKFLRQDAAALAIAAFTLLPSLLFFVFQSQPRYHAFMIPGLLWLAARILFTRYADA